MRPEFENLTLVRKIESIAVSIVYRFTGFTLLKTSQLRQKAVRQSVMAHLFARSHTENTLTGANCDAQNMCVLRAGSH